MKSLPKLNVAQLLCRYKSSMGCITTKRPSRILSAYAVKQRGVVLFLTLLALLAMSLAAVALIRSVDTAAMIVGNLAFQQAATAAGSTEIEQGINWLTVTPANALDNSQPGAGYYSFVVDADLTDPAEFNWDTQSSPPTVDANRNIKRFVIHRLCRLANTPVADAECLLAPRDAANTSSQAVKGHDEANDKDDKQEGMVQYRITVRTEGPKNTRSYVQAFVY